MVEVAPGIGVLDASVVVKMVVPEAGTAESVGLFDQPFRWMAPRLMTIEVAAALRQKVVAGAISIVDAEAALSAMLDAVADGVIGLADDEMLARSALNLALTLRHKVPDCLYLALAEREGGLLASADRQLLALARRRGIEVAAIPSA